MSWTIPSPIRWMRGVRAIGLISLVAWSVVIGGYVRLAEPFRPSGAPETVLARDVLLGLLLASAIAIAVAFVTLHQPTRSRGRAAPILALLSGFVLAVALIFVANAVALALVYDSMAVVGPMLTAVVPLGVALVAMLLAAMSPDRKRSSLQLAFGLGAWLGLTLFLLNLTNGYMNVLYE